MESSGVEIQRLSKFRYNTFKGEDQALTGLSEVMNNKARRMKSHLLALKCILCFSAPLVFLSSKGNYAEGFAKYFHTLQEIGSNLAYHLNGFDFCPATPHFLFVLFTSQHGF